MSADVLFRPASNNVEAYTLPSKCSDRLCRSDCNKSVDVGRSVTVPGDGTGGVLRRTQGFVWRNDERLRIAAGHRLCLQSASATVRRAPLGCFQLETRARS